MEEEAPPSIEENQPKASAAALAFAQAAAQATVSGAEALACANSEKKAKPLPPLYETRALANELLAANLRNVRNTKATSPISCMRFGGRRIHQKTRTSRWPRPSRPSTNIRVSMTRSGRSLSCWAWRRSSRRRSIKRASRPGSRRPGFSVLRKLISGVPRSRGIARSPRRVLAAEPRPSSIRRPSPRPSPSRRHPTSRRLVSDRCRLLLMSVLFYEGYTYVMGTTSTAAPGSISFDDVSMLLLEHMATPSRGTIANYWRRSPNSTMTTTASTGTDRGARVDDGRRQ